MTRREWALVLTAALVGAVLASLLYARLNPPAPKPKTVPLVCQPDPAKAIAALPSGSVFSGHGCYTTHGITVPSGVTVDGGTYDDIVSSAPVFSVRDVDNVTIENIAIKGTDTTSTYDASKVNNAAIGVFSAHVVNLSHIDTAWTWGDGLEVWFDPAFHDNGSQDVTVTDYHVGSAGRWAFDPSQCYRCTFTDVSGKSWDLESDTTVETGPITVTDCTFTHALLIQEALNGPVSFTDCTGSGQVTITASGAPVTISHSKIATPPYNEGYPPASIFIRGADVVLSGDTFTRSGTVPPNLKGSPAYLCETGSLSVTGSTFVGPAGQAYKACALTK